MTSTQEEIEVSYDVSNEFFKLWLDEDMHYTSASYLTGEETLEEAQRNKSRILYEYAEIEPDKLVLDVGCGWGSNLNYLHQRGVKRAHGITLSTAQQEWTESRGSRVSRPSSAITRNTSPKRNTMRSNPSR